VSNGALTGLVVLDLSQNISGPYCTKLLADYGADVIKIEKPRMGDISRHAGPFPNPLNAILLNPPFVKGDLGGFCRGEPTCSPTAGRHTGLPLRDTINPTEIEKSGLFLFLNTSKKSITLDIEHNIGRDIFKRLAQQADIVVENFKPGTMERLGLGYETLSKNNPDLIMASISYFGQTGPCRDWNGSDIIAQAMGGLMHLTGKSNREPLKLPLSQAEYQAGSFTATQPERDNTSTYLFRKPLLPSWKERSAHTATAATS
jgi:CoA:oxalate CoA-transferase